MRQLLKMLHSVNDVIKMMFHSGNGVVKLAVQYIDDSIVSMVLSVVLLTFQEVE